jgi:hypothetical protein
VWDAASAEAGGVADSSRLARTIRHTGLTSRASSAGWAARMSKSTAADWTFGRRTNYLPANHQLSSSLEQQSMF